MSSRQPGPIPGPPSPDRLARALVAGGGEAAQGEDERDRVEEVAVAVLEPAAAVVEERRDQDGDRRAGAATRSRLSRHGARTA